MRYTVKLSFTLGNKRYKNQFSLANRANNHFPVLLGRKFLKNRFLVDVSRHHLLSSELAPAKVLVLVKYGTTKTKSFFKNMEGQSQAQLTVSNYDELVFSSVGALNITIGINGTDVADHKLVYFKSHIANSELASAIATYLDFRNIIYRDSELASAVSRGKLTEAVRLKAHGICMPPMVAMKYKMMQANYGYLIERLGLPFVFKDTLSNRGKSNYLISNEVDFKKVLQQSESASFFMAQKYVPNTGYIRVIIMGSQQAPIIIARSSTGHANPLKSHLNNPAGGHNATLMNIDDADPAMIDLARRAARVMERQVAGVDMIQDTQTGEWYVLEVNNNPQLMSGSFVKEKSNAFAKYLKNELDRW